MWEFISCGLNPKGIASAQLTDATDRSEAGHGLGRARRRCVFPFVPATHMVCINHRPRRDAGVVLHIVVGSAGFAFEGSGQD